MVSNESTRAPAAPEHSRFGSPELQELILENLKPVQPHSGNTDSTGRYVDNWEFRAVTSAYAEAFCRGTVPQTQEAWRNLVEYLERLAAPIAAREPEPVARELSDLITYPSPHGTLVRLADVQCRFAARELDADAEQEAFESWIGLNGHTGPKAERFEDTYDDNYVGEMWEAWQARAALVTRATAESAPASAAPSDAVIAAARKLVKAKGRYHTEQNYKALMAEVAEYDALAAAVAKLDSSPVGAEE